MRTSSVLVCTFLLAACGGSTTPDAGTDASIDAAGSDVGAPDSGGACPDSDADGHHAMSCGGDDCDDADPLRYPGATEICDAANHDEDCDAHTFGFRDADSDGFGDIACCNGATCGDDCNDSNTNVHPSQTETCNGADDNCDGITDEGAMISYVADCDGDHYGAGTPMVQCAPPVAAPASCPTGAWVTVGGDCDDTTVDVSPGLTEICDRFGHDEDCDPATLGLDADGDGAPATFCCDRQAGGALLCGTDCDDSDPVVHAGASETCNGVDDDCNRMRDDGLSGCSATVPGTGSVLCPTAACSLTTETCCQYLYAATAMCVAGVGTGLCGGTPEAHCDGPEDCSGGDVCCGTVTGSFVCAASCAVGELELCHGDVDCLASEVCGPVTNGPAGGDRVIAHSCQPT